MLEIRTKIRIVKYESKLQKNERLEVQYKDLNIVEPMDKILSDYVKRFHEIKTPHSMIFSFKY